MIRAARLFVAATCMLGLVGCASVEAQSVTHARNASDTIPALNTTLTKLEAALVHHDYVEARRDLVLLLQEVRQSKAAHKLSATSASQIVSAAGSLMSQLPQASTTASPTVNPTYRPSDAASPRPTAHPSARRTTRPNHRPTVAPGPATPSPTTPSSPPPSAPATPQVTPTTNPTPTPTP